MGWLSETFGALAMALGITGQPAPTVLTGYVEGEYLRLAVPLAGRLESSPVRQRRDGRVVEGAGLENR